jgi:hypothetical protein
MLFVLSMIVPCLGMAEEAEKATGEAASEKSYDDWHFVYYIAPAWLPAFSGHVTSKGKTASVHVNYGQMLENLQFAKGAGFGHLEVKKGRWVLLVEGLYAKFSDQANVLKDIKPPIIVPIEISVAGQVKVTTAASFDETSVLYDLYRSDSTIRNQPVLTVEALLGARYLYFGTSATVSTLGPLAVRSVSFSKKQDWVDPIIGGRVLWNLGNRWMVGFRGDVGGFGLVSRFTLNLDAFVVYRANNWLRFVGGYRALYEDHVEGGGINKFVYDMWTYAPYVGVGVEF